jgi:hypothetical protein
MKIREVKPKIIIAGTGSVDECECCNETFLSGAACFLVDKEIFINLCDICIKNRFKEIKK